MLQAGPAARVRGLLSNDRVPGRETVSSMARRAGALAAVNGGYFGSKGVFDGDPVGALALGGRLLSEPVASRAALLLPREGRPVVRRLHFAGSVAAGGSRRLLDGVNRVNGLIPACGGRGGDRPTEGPDSASVCSDESELILFSPEYGRRAPTASLQAVVERDSVTRLREGGGARIPAGGYVLSGTGSAVAFLRSFAGPGAAIRTRTALRAPTRRISPGLHDTIVGGGPLLLRDGRVRLRPRVEGFSAPFAARNPRTLAGIAATGELLLVTVDGRNAAHSVGVTLVEAARVMRVLGARAALNLDGGGSTTLSIEGYVVNRPSDGSERPVGDALAVLGR